MAESSSRGLGQKAYQALVQALEDGSLAPDSRVVEGELASRLNMSRTPLREALQRLESEGLLIHEPRRGLVISRLTQEKVVELYRMREVLEGAAAAFAAQHASPVEIEVLQQMCRHELEVMSDPVAGGRHNRQLHQSIFRSAHNSYLLRNISTLTSSMALLGNYTRHVKGRAEQAAKEHSDIVAAIASRNVQHAEEVARAHVRAAQEARLKDISGI
jgi:DNA-binding GntR family transcriptional regulator